MPTIILEMSRLPSRRLVTLAIALLACSAGCRSPYYADQGALWGGLAGAGLGAAIGDANGNAGSGAVIGSALGALTGATVGEALDESEARNRALIEERLGRSARGAVTNSDVVEMSQAGLSDEVVITHIRTNGLAQELTSADDLIDLKTQGVSDRVIKAMQNPPPPVRTRVVQPRPVIVEEYYRSPFPPSYMHYHHSRPIRRHRRGGTHWGFSFSN